MKLPWFTSDTHFGHGNIIEFCKRPFTSVEEMDEALIENHNKCVKPKDVVYHLGDVSWYGSDRIKKIFDRLNGQKHLIIGNHDHRKNLASHFESMKDYDMLKIQGMQFALMHYPILSWAGRYHGAIHLHGHTHDTIDNSGTLRFDVGVDSWGMHPVNLEQIIELIPKRLAEDPTNLQGPVSKFKKLYERATQNDSGTKVERVG